MSLFIRTVTFAASFGACYITLLPDDLVTIPTILEVIPCHENIKIRFTGLSAVLGVPRIDALVSASNIGLSLIPRLCNQPPIETRWLTSQLGRILAKDRELL